jgi:hypothetical protein
VTDQRPEKSSRPRLSGKHILFGPQLGEEVIVADNPDEVLRALFKTYPAINDAGLLHRARRRIAESVAFQCRTNSVAALEADEAFGWRLADQPIVIQKLLRLGPADWIPMVPAYPSSQPRLVVASHLLGRAFDGSVRRVVVLDASTASRLIGGLIEIGRISVVII